ncbi:calcium-dependent secretion activator 2-like [Pempheris klunzingeri]|uniref:calcium-dependent secretion activator 2-like n=1 Tax=Pempheris klunzingeri TaxID=3127111 RepID=UPI00397F494D
MLDPSSSEDTGGESDPEVVQETPKKPAASSAGKRGDSGRAGGQKRQTAAPGGAAGKSAKDNSSTGEEEERKERERIQKEEEERKIKLQIYVFVLRCIAYPFNAKQPTDMARRQQKVNKQQLQAGKERFQAFLNGETQIVADEAFCNAVRSYYEQLLDERGSLKHSIVAFVSPTKELTGRKITVRRLSGHLCPGVIRPKLFMIQTSS